MSQKLFVGRLSYNTTVETLQTTFAQAGTVVSAVVITDKMTGRSRGFGFVEMSSEEEAQKAIEMFINTELDGRTIAVSVARPLADRPAGGGGRFNKGPRRSFEDRGEQKEW